MENVIVVENYFFGVKGQKISSFIYHEQFTLHKYFHKFC